MAKQMYVEFALEYGRFLPEYSVEKVSDSNPSSVNPPDRTYAFQFYWREEMEKDGELLTGKRHDIGPLYFIDGKVESLEDVEKRNDPNERILRDNMTFNEYDVIHTRYGRCLPFDPAKHEVIAA